MEPQQMAILAAGGLVAGIVNTLAGGGSMLTVGLLVMLGLPGTIANGTNRIGILVQSAVATWRFRREGIEALSASLPALLPVAAGSLLGALAIARVADDTFERTFGIVMLLVLAPTLRAPRASTTSSADAEREPWPSWLRTLIFFAIGVYGGSFQAGVGIALILALSRSGYDLVTANAIKVLVVGAVTLVAVPVFIFEGQVSWQPALILAAGFAVGGTVGVRIAVGGGEQVIRPVLGVAVIALAGRMLGFY